MKQKFAVLLASLYFWGILYPDLCFVDGVVESTETTDQENDAVQLQESSQVTITCHLWECISDMEGKKEHGIGEQQ
ncbi:MAG: hypothetical protein PHP50_02230 [Lachnospiraceae bacterium]|nr:hypothetical protein [Lachnospiraceae bacterium]